MKKLIISLSLGALLAVPILVFNVFTSSGVSSTFNGGYRTVDKLYEDLRAVASSFPALVQLVDYGDSYSKTAGGVTTPGGEVLGGYDLLAAKVTNTAIVGPKPVFMLAAGLHAWEISTPELAMRFLNWLVTEYGRDPDVTWLVDHHEIWVLPVTNPDGRWYVALGTQPPYSGSYWWWRKNGHYQGNKCTWPATGTAATTYGVDLNRNFDFKWGLTSHSSPNLCSKEYRGTAPASEPEVVAWQNLLRSLFPDQRGPNDTDAAPDDTTGIFIQLHSPFKNLSWPWAHTATPAPNAIGLRAIGQKLASYSGFPSGQANTIVYPMSGTADEWTYGVLGVPSYMIELNGFAPTYSNIESLVWPPHKELFRYAAKIARAPYQLSRGPDATLLTPLQTAEGIELRGTINDTANGNQLIAAAEFYVDTPPWVSGAVRTPLLASDGSFNTPSEAVQALISTASLTPGQHLVFVRGQDSAGNWGPVSSTFLNKVVGPTVDIKANGLDAITIPYNTSATISWSSQNADACSVSPSGWTGISGSQPTGNLIASQTYTLTCTGFGGSASKFVTVTVNPQADVIPPTVSIISPANGVTVADMVTISATTSDNVAVSGVQFKLDGVNLGAEDTSSPYSTSWDTRSAANGLHTITAVVRDAAGNTGISSTVTVTVNNDIPPPPPEPPKEIIIDNMDGATSITKTGSWCLSSAKDFYGTNSFYSCGGGLDTFRWTPSLIETDRYEIFMWWSTHPQRATNALIRIVDAGGNTTIRTVNEKMDGGKWNFLGTYTMGLGSYVETNDHNGQVAADAVRFVKSFVSPPPPLSELIIDNGQSGTSKTGTWCQSSSGDYYGTGSLYSCGSSLDTYRWTPTLDTQGTYEVQMWWTTHIKRSIQGVIKIRLADGTTYTTSVNEQINGGQWNSLATLTLGPGSYVETTDESGQVAADAVKFVKVVTPTAMTDTQKQMASVLAGIQQQLNDIAEMIKKLQK